MELCTNWYIGHNSNFNSIGYFPQLQGETIYQKGQAIEKTVTQTNLFLVISHISYTKTQVI